KAMRPVESLPAVERALPILDLHLHAVPIELCLMDPAVADRWGFHEFAQLRLDEAGGKARPILALATRQLLCTRPELGWSHPAETLLRVLCLHGRNHRRTPVTDEKTNVGSRDRDRVAGGEGYE